MYGQNLSEAKKSPQEGETKIGGVSMQKDGGYYRCVVNFGYSNPPETEHKEINYSEQELYKALVDEAKKRYSKEYTNFKLRDFRVKFDDKEGSWEDYPSYKARKGYYSSVKHTYKYYFSASVVLPNHKEQTYEAISKAVDKALLNVRFGSKLAVDAVSASDGEEREEYKDYLLNLLLDKGYKVVAKEYLEKLYNEQQAQQSGIYNERTTVRENNFTAVGFFISLKVSESQVKVLVVNVSTGEYEGNVAVSLNTTNSKVNSNTTNLSKAIDRALSNVREGSRIAVDGVSVQNGNKEDYRDQVVNLLLDKSYKVVAKEYLEKLYEEQQNQQSGIYNERTTVQENNFSAVGYYLNVKVTETSIRVHVVNVSTGEYEGSSTINF